jgi:hypothetical protein
MMSQSEDHMAGPIGLGQQGYVSWKSIKKNWVFALCSTVIVVTFLYFWMKW